MSETAVSTYRVGTTYDRSMHKQRPVRHKVKAYTRFYGLEWDELIEYDVKAKSGEEARTLARELRFQYECKRYVSS